MLVKSETSSQRGLLVLTLEIGVAVGAEGLVVPHDRLLAAVLLVADPAAHELQLRQAQLLRGDVVMDRLMAGDAGRIGDLGKGLLVAGLAIADNSCAAPRSSRSTPCGRAAARRR